MKPLFKKQLRLRAMTNQSGEITRRFLLDQNRFAYKNVATIPQYRWNEDQQKPQTPDFPSLAVPKVQYERPNDTLTIVGVYATPSREVNDIAGQYARLWFPYEKIDNPYGLADARLQLRFDSLKAAW